MDTNRRITLGNKLAFGIGDLYGGGSFFIISALFLVYLTDIAKLDSGLAATILLIGKIWDAVTDPAMGYISDHTQSKRGRRRLYFLIGIVTIFLSFLSLWTFIELYSHIF